LLLHTGALQQRIAISNRVVQLQCAIVVKSATARNDLKNKVKSESNLLFDQINNWCNTSITCLI